MNGYKVGIIFVSKSIKSIFMAVLLLSSSINILAEDGFWSSIQDGWNSLEPDQKDILIFTGVCFAIYAAVIGGILYYDYQRQQKIKAYNNQYYANAAYNPTQISLYIDLDSTNKFDDDDLMQPYKKTDWMFRTIYSQSEDDSHKDDVEGLLNTEIDGDSSFKDDPKVKKWQETYTKTDRSDDLKITWVGHSTLLIQVGGINILTDPMFFDLSKQYPRSCNPGISINDLPQIDFVILSHDHRDHLNEESLAWLAYYQQHGKQPIALCPNGKVASTVKDSKLSSLPNYYYYGDKHIKETHEMDWWEQKTFNTCKKTTQQTSTFVYNEDLKCDEEITVEEEIITNEQKITFTFLPAVHWCQRHSDDLNLSLWGSWMIECNGKTIYFAGDSAKGEHFEQISSKFSNIDVAMMPIAPNDPRDAFKDGYLSAEESITAFEQLGAKDFIPIHWGTFKLGSEEFIDPITYLKGSWNLDDDRMHVLKFGETYNG